MKTIKISRNTLDYHIHAKFLAYTMNTFIRSIMKKGKYKKAMRLARLGLLFCKKRVYYHIKQDYFDNILSTYKRMKPTEYTNSTRIRLKKEVSEVKKDKKESGFIPNIPYWKKTKFQDFIFNHKYMKYYSILLDKIIKTEQSISFYTYYNLISEKDKLESYFKEMYKKQFNKDTDSDDESSLWWLTDDEYEPELVDLVDGPNNEGLAEVTREPNSENPAKLKIDYLTQLEVQYNLIENKLKFKKIYTKKPPIWFYRHRHLSVFDMVTQVYSTLSGIWYMRKAKVSGRTVLVPSPIRPYRRIVTANQMLLKGIRQFRRVERFQKKAMIYWIGMEFFYLVMFYGRTRHPSVTPSYVWQLKLKSQKELISNLKNIKYMNYY